MANKAIDAEQSAAITNPILVTGAARQTGSLGFNMVAILRARWLPVRAMVRRDNNRCKAFVKLGVSYD